MDCKIVIVEPFKSIKDAESVIDDLLSKNGKIRLNPISIDFDVYDERGNDNVNK